jgi:hypothetical protein
VLSVVDRGWVGRRPSDRFENQDLYSLRAGLKGK